MKAKFTKGPWVKDSRGECLINPDGENIIVWGCGLSSATKTDERVANAHLISSAPDMYKLLIEFKSFAERQGWDHVLINDAENLLAKARGEQ
jgi:hypothetical protein